MDKNCEGLAISAKEKRRDDIDNDNDNDSANNNRTNNKLGNVIVKAEITIGPEEITETHFVNDYDFRQTNEPIMQVEIYADADNYVEKDDIVLPQIDTPATRPNVEQMLIEKLEDSHILSDVMSDHNYMSQELVNSESTIGSIRGHLLSRLLSQHSGSGDVTKQVRAFVDKTVDSIELFETDVLCNDNDSEKSAEKQDECDINSSESRYKFGTGKQTNLSEDESQDEKSTIVVMARQFAHLGSNDDTRTVCSLPNDCSEPMEFETSSELLVDIKEDNKVQLPKTDKFLSSVMEFAKNLYNDCGTFMSATSNVDDKVAHYLKSQLQKFRTLAVGEHCVEQAMQTESRTSNKKRRMNYKAKQKLFADCIYSTDSDSESSSTCSRSSCTSTTTTKSVGTKKEEEEGEIVAAQLEKHDVETNTLEYDDGIDISKYMQSDIFDAVFPNSPPVQSESDKENKKHKLESSGDDTDKEVDRLTNLSGLSKRQPFTAAKHTPSDKQKSKTLCQKNNNIIDFSDDETENYNSNNKSILENEDEEIISEHEFKSRCNADVKRQLLDESSSDSDEPEQSDTDMVNKLTSDEEDADNSLLVDKFLESYTVDLSDAEEAVEEFESKSIKTTKSVENESQSSDCIKETNDFDYLNDNLERKRKGKSKTLEKMLLEAEKRNNTANEEIVLSSESEYSDVEAVDVEPVEEKSRVIKAMLRPDQLANETRKAQKMETERLRKLEKQQGILTKALKQHSDKVTKGEVVLDYLEEHKLLIKVHPAIVVHLKPHQIDGIKFMYESCYCGAVTSAKNPGSGCILAHCMGLGKTLQLIALIHTVVSYPQLKTNRVLVLCPKSTVMNWADEMQRWLGPFQKDKHLKVFVFTEPSDISEKLQVLEEWAASTSKRAGCLLLGYEAFRTLVFYHSYKSRINLSPQRLQEIKDKIDKFLLEPGADLAVCDEGHIIKNSKSAISLAVAKIKTPRRIILTGTPIQNNLKEYYSMVNFIKPLYLGTEKEFANLYANPIKNGQHKDSNKQDIKVMKQRSFVLHKKLSKFVQRKEAELLKTFLPSKFEYVLFVPMTLVQRKLYEHIIGAISARGDNRGKSLITDYTCLRKIWTHPKVLQDAWKNATDQKIKNDARKAQASAGHSDDDQPDDIYDSQTGVMSVTNDWWRHLLTNKDLETIMPSNKMRAMFEILRMCEEKGEKCLIFSAFVAVLNVVEYFFAKITNKDPELLQQISFGASQKVSNVWISGQDYYRLDGKTPKAIRHEMIKRFNSPTNMRSRVFLISSKAGGQGINLTGANRVIILDTSWNPSNDQQNIFRIFRLGQKRNCYIYRLLAMGTMEEKVYSRSVTKQAMSFRVVDEQQIDRHYNMAELAELYSLTDIKESERPMPILPKDSILASLLMNHPDVVYKYHEHDSLLENKVEQELSEQEKADAWATYERELQMNMETQEAPNMDRMQNNLFAAKMPNYNGSIPGLDMQALLSYGMFSSQAAPMMSSFSNNYATSANQYLEALYRNFSLGYPDLTPQMHGSNPYGSSYGAINPTQKSLGAAASMSALHGVPTTANPLAALSDLGMLGTHAQKLYSNPAASVPSLHAGHVNAFPTTAMQSNTGLPLGAKNLNPTYSPYGPVHRADPSHQSYFNFVNEFSGLLNPLSAAAQQLTGAQQSALDLPQPTNLQKSANAVLQEALSAHPLNLNSKQAPVVDKMHQKEKLPATDYLSLSTKKPDNAQKDLPSANSTSFHNAAPTKHLPEHKAAPQQQQQQPANLPTLVTPQKTTSTPTAPLPASSQQSTSAVSKRPTTNFSSYAKPSVAAPAPPPPRTKNVPPPVNVQKKPPPPSQPNMVSSNEKAVNIGIHYPPLKEINSSAAKSTDLMKSTSEMQIIPTTSPPGTSSISKHFLEISPSISLTAVRNSNTSTKTMPSSASTGGNAGGGGVSGSSGAAVAKATSMQKQNFNMPTNRGNNNNNNNNNNPSGNGLIISKAVNKAVGPKALSVVTSNSMSGGSFTPTSMKSLTSGVSVTAKAAAASMVLAKATGQSMTSTKPVNSPAGGMKMRVMQKGNIGGIMSNLNVHSPTSTHSPSSSATSASSLSTIKDTNSNLNPGAVYGGANDSMKKVNLLASNPKARNIVTTKVSSGGTQKEGLSALPAKSATTTPASMDMRGMMIKSGLPKVFERKRNGDEIRHLSDAKSQKLSQEPK